MVTDIIERLAIIPARGGSKRLPRKNIKSFCDKPIISYSIEAAQKSGLFDEIIVSTDDQEIANISQDYGAKVPFVRPDNIADDVSKVSDVIKHTLNWYKSQGIKVRYVCCIYATVPLLHFDYLIKGYDKLVKSDKKFCFSVTSFPFPVQRAIRIIDGSGVEPIWPENIYKKSQHLEDAYHDAGQFYWGTARAFLEGIDLFSVASVPIILPRHRVQDIDTPEDWQRAELLYKAIMLSEGAET